MSDNERLEMTNTFLSIRIWGLPFLLLYQLRNALLVGINMSHYLVIGTLVETIFNVFFDWVLIYGHLGFPEMGYTGAAYASIIAEAAGLIVIMFLIQRPEIKNKILLKFSFRPNKEIITQILVVSAPLILQFLISVISWEYFYLSIEHYGARELAISSLMRTIFGFFGSFTWAFASTTTTMVSNVMGQGKPEEVLPLVRRIVKLAFTFAFVMFILINILPETFFSIFGQGEAFIADALPVIRVVSSALLFMSISCIWLNAVVGTGNTRITLLSEVIAIVFYCAYVYIVTDLYRQPVHVAWMSEWVYWTALFAVSFTYMMKGNWRLKEI
jgi:Na+-driven multidrug efflux pump